TAPFYNDRIIAHEMTHAIMATGTNWGAYRSSVWFVEGTAEFIHGADERVLGDSFGDNGAAIQAIAAGFAAAPGSWGGTSTDYSAGYLAVRYLYQMVGDTTFKAIMNHLQTAGTGTETLSTALAANTGWANETAFLNSYANAIGTTAADFSSFLTTFGVDLS
ncbi:hypothetical protein ACQV5M_21365, partial [Leptospira sp. SA-E8]|uniref:hypothetical protein n=1 Tax=Leptospira sp. SA-E8 TaxID=3422259 RepID=UPI003EBA85BD